MRTRRLVMIGAICLATVATVTTVAFSAEAREIRGDHGHNRWGRGHRSSPSASARPTTTARPSSPGTATQPPGATTAPPATTAAPTGAAPTGAAPAGWKLAWAEDFTGPAGTSPSSKTWNFDTGGEPNWGNNEWEYYTNRPENVSLDGNGNLAITARREKLAGMNCGGNGTCDITSGRITSKGKFEQQYGRLEASIKVPKGTGLWPAFWMMGANSDAVSWPACGELDIMESVNNMTTLEGTAWGGSGALKNGKGGTLSYQNGLSDGFHVYAVEWDATAITWYLDSKAYYTLKKSEVGSWPFDQKFYFLLNLAVGGEMPGSGPGASTLPATMLVNYVHTYTKA